MIILGFASTTLYTH